MLVPAYFYPSEEGLAAWKRLIATADKAPVPIVAIVNPHNGPGTAVDPNYQEIFRLMARSKLTPIGYVKLGYGKRPADEVNADVDRWLTFYPGVRGIFFDEQPSDAALAPLVRNCFSYARVKIRKGVFYSNPGTVCAGVFRRRRRPDALFVRESRGFRRLSVAADRGAVGPGRVAVLLYDVKPADAARRFRQALQKQAGTVYVTDAAGANPWDRLPSYWDAEVAEAAKGRP